MGDWPDTGGGKLPLLWLCGPSGVGKSTTGWEIYSQVDSAGYVDLDQIGLCYPATAGDPHNHRLKAVNLGRMVPNFRAAGARCLVVSGCVESAELVRGYAEQLAGTELTLCRLRAGADELRRRFVQRGWMIQLADASVREAQELERTDFADFNVDTDGWSAAELAGEIRRRAGRRAS